MTHCFKTSHLIKFPLGLASRCGTLEWNLIHKNNQPAPPPAVAALSRHARRFSALPLNVPPLVGAEQPLVPAPAPPQHLVRYMARVTRQLEAARLLQATGRADPALLPPGAALSHCERRAFRGAALASQPGDPPERPAEEKEREKDRPTPDQLKAVEANLLLNLPRIFVMTQDFSIYHQNLVFDNRIRGTKSVGIVPYIKQCALLRVVGHIKFSYVTLDVLQSSIHHEDDTIRIRWRIRGVSALRSMLMFWKFNVFKMGKGIDEYGVDWYDGYSIFQVGGDGKVHTHIADKVMPDWSRDQLEAKPALGSLAALVYGLLPGGAATCGEQLSHLLTAQLASLLPGAAGSQHDQLQQLLKLSEQLERLERQIETLLPLGAPHFKTAGET